MKNKIEKREKMRKELNGATKDKRQPASSEEAYHQLNRASFEQDFKALLGHYKNESWVAKVNLKDRPLT